MFIKWKIDYFEMLKDLIKIIINQFSFSLAASERIAISFYCLLLLLTIGFYEITYLTLYKSVSCSFRKSKLN